MRGDFVRPNPDERDLSFRPADPSVARTLRRADIEQYNSQGFIAPLPLFDGSEVRRLHTYIGELLDNVRAQTGDPGSSYLNSYHLVCEGLYALTQTPLLLDYVEDILGPDYVCWGTTVFCKLSGDPREVPLHQDAAYWPFTPTRSVTAWLAIDDVDEENAAMEFVPASHLFGALDHEDLPMDGTRVSTRQVVDAQTYKVRHINALSAGQVSLHTDLLLHGSQANRSGRRRAGVTARYAAADVRALASWEWWHTGSIHCRGTIPAWWANRRRPRGEHPELMAALMRQGGAGAPDAGL